MHLGQTPPPQSTSVSRPFCAMSVQEAPLTQRLFVQLLLWQSLPATHFWPAAQRAHMLAPPQSTSVSPPFCTMSVQVAATQTRLRQVALWQSLAILHICPLAQALPCDEQLPPQSTSVSLPFMVMSPQVAA